MQKMQRQTTPKGRGRPISRLEGAREAFDVIEAYRISNNWTINALAIQARMTPSTVGRVLKSRSQAKWTPAFGRLYCIALNNSVPPLDVPALQSLMTYEGPGQAAVKRILADMGELVTALATARQTQA